MSETFDVIVAGAGHNALIATAYLAKAGLRCLVLEARPEIGGDTSVEEIPLPDLLGRTVEDVIADRQPIT